MHMEIRRTPTELKRMTRGLHWGHALRNMAPVNNWMLPANDFVSAEHLQNTYGTPVQRRNI